MNHLKLLTKASLAYVALGVLTVASLAFCMRNIYDLPIVDFRAYKTKHILKTAKKQLITWHLPKLIVPMETKQSFLHFYEEYKKTIGIFQIR